MIMIMDAGKIMVNDTEEPIIQAVKFIDVSLIVNSCKFLILTLILLIKKQNSEQRLQHKIYSKRYLHTIM